MIPPAWTALTRAHPGGLAHRRWNVPCAALRQVCRPVLGKPLIMLETQGPREEQRLLGRALSSSHTIHHVLTLGRVTTQGVRTGLDLQKQHPKCRCGRFEGEEGAGVRCAAGRSWGLLSAGGRGPARLALCCLLYFLSFISTEAMWIRQHFPHIQNEETNSQAAQGTRGRAQSLSVAERGLKPGTTAPGGKATCLPENVCWRAGWHVGETQASGSESLEFNAG